MLLDMDECSCCSSLFVDFVCFDLEKKKRKWNCVCVDFRKLVYHDVKMEVVVICE